MSVFRARDDPLKLEETVYANLAQVCIAIFDATGSLLMALVYSWMLRLV